MPVCESCDKMCKSERGLGTHIKNSHSGEEREMLMWSALERRFWAKVDKRKEDECWIWTAYRNGDGYGYIRFDGDNRRAHRVAYSLEHEPPGDDMVLHHCDTPACVNPVHLYLGDQSHNLQDAWDRGRRNEPGLTYSPGESNPNARLTETDVREIRQRAKGDITYRELAADYDVSHRTIGEVVRRESWPHVDENNESLRTDGGTDALDVRCRECGERYQLTTETGNDCPACGFASFEVVR